MKTTTGMSPKARLAIRLMRGGSVALIAAMTAASAYAQTTAASAASTESTVGEITVTGTSIRGAAPVGSSIVTVGQAQIDETGAQTMQDVLKSVPSVVGLQSAGQGSFGSADASGTDAPTIHGLGASASNSTLVLIDGHRFPLSGINHQLGDPNIIPPIAIQRVEVLSDGASSIYGSDAVAGVVNFITRSHYNGLEVQGQRGFGDHYNSANIGLIAGKDWDSGSAYVAYDYSNKSALQAQYRPYTAANHTSQGGSNLSSFACGQATIQPSGSSTIYTAPYTSGVSNAQANAMCDYTGLADLLPSEIRNTIYTRIEQQVSDKLTLRGDISYSDRDDVQRNTRGSVTATIFGPGNANASQINPYYIFPTGSAATSETVRFDADSLLGPGAHTNSGSKDFFANGEVEYKLGHDWRVTLAGTHGEDTSRQQIYGALCSSCALLSLNGTTNASGSLTTVSVPATGLIVTQTPLTTANALDPFVITGNPTSAAVLKNLTDSTQTYVAHSTISDVTLKVDGSLFKLPAGDVKAAAGAEYAVFSLTQDITRPLNIGPATSGSATTNLAYGRNVASGYLELLAPLIGPDQNIPLVHRLDLDVSGRYDRYNDFGSTTNPKIGINWEPIAGLVTRANFAESFVAPALTSIGSGGGVTGETGIGAYGLGAINVPIAIYPTVTAIPGISCTATTCLIGSGNITGAQLSGGNANLKAQTGKTWSFGADYKPTFLKGLTLSATFWHNEIQGGITSPQPVYAVSATSLNNRLVIYPAGATQAQLAALRGAAPVTGTIPVSYFTYDFTQGNVLNLWVEGVDLTANYAFETGFGRFTLAADGSFKTRFDQQFGSTGTKFSVLNTTGFNTTFPSIKFSSRVGAGWDWKAVSANLFWNHTDSYRNWGGSTVAPLTRNAAGLPTGGGDLVKANDTFDLHLGYDIEEKGLLHALELYVDVNNLFDKAPPFYNSTAGYDTFSSSPIGRVTSVGIRKTF